MEFLPLTIPDVLLVKPAVKSDERGFFMETYRHSEFSQAGISLPFVQDNHSRSRQGVLRGLHYQVHQAQGKLVRVIAGEVFDVAVDLRRSSPTFGAWEGTRLSAENKHQLWVPPGFAHGFYVLSEWAELVYKVTDYWAPAWERTLLWNDPDVAVRWPVPPGQAPQLSDKDAQGMRIKDLSLEDSFA